MDKLRINQPDLMIVGMKNFDFGEIEEKVQGERYFTFKGYLSTFGNVDLVDDVCLEGCFRESLQKMTPKLLYQHNWDDPIGVFTEIREDSKGLYVEGKMPLADNLVKGKIAPQMKIGSIDSMSIGYRTRVAEYDEETGIRTLKKVDLYEGSIVTLPANPEARIEAVKSLRETFKENYETPKQKISDFKFADMNHIFNPELALNSIKEAGLDNVPELPVFDVIDGKAFVIPRALFALKAQIIGAKGGFDGDVEFAKEFLNKYYEKMNLEAPFKEGREVTFCETEMKNLPLSEMSYIFRNGKLSKSCSDYFSRKAFEFENSENSPDDSDDSDDSDLKELNSFFENEILKKES